jgi:hypothetical protein
MFLNWPPVLRAMLASIWMFGILPPKCKDYQQMLLPVVEQLAEFAPGPDGVDLEVYDADSDKYRALRVMLAFILNDIRAVPCGTCGKHPPCYVGSCNFCKQTGHREHNRTVLGGAVRGVGLGTTSHTRRAFHAPCLSLRVPTIRRIKYRMAYSYRMPYDTHPYRGRRQSPARRLCQSVPREQTPAGLGQETETRRANQRIVHPVREPGVVGCVYQAI